MKRCLDHCPMVLPGAQWKDLDPLEFDRLRRTVGANCLGDKALLDLTDLEIAQALGALEMTQHVRVLGLLLFGREDAIRMHIPTHEVALQEFRADRVRLDTVFRWPLFRVMDTAREWFTGRCSEQEIIMGASCIGVSEYSEEAFCEGVANALIHRDYEQMGTVRIQWRDQTLVITSPGGLPDDICISDILRCRPHPRSYLLAEAFRRAACAVISHEFNECVCKFVFLTAYAARPYPRIGCPPSTPERAERAKCAAPAIRDIVLAGMPEMRIS